MDDSLTEYQCALYKHGNTHTQAGLATSGIKSETVRCMIIRQLKKLVKVKEQNKVFCPGFLKSFFQMVICSIML